jgi:DNA polymerase-3 subunit gamma/tau
MLSLYRRHRPKTFDEVVGQESVVRTLRNAIELDKVHHAYLFVGSRGTGKTSMAKLLACALNAPGGPSADVDPASPTTQAIMAGTSLDVVEMDAASNNSVDDIRELRENVALAPMGGARRVYILDEAHMLSAAAWNAFLKTLEEPPAHVVFVLATTEAHKVPATIVDRCHRFDFQRPSLDQIAGVLRRVADQEGIVIPDAAIGMIARKASGSFRDALGTLEQLVTYGGKEVALDDVLANLGVADAELILETAETIAAGDPRAALLAVQKLTESGRDEAQFMRDLSAHLRHLYVIQTMGEVPDSFAVTAEHTDRLAGQAERLGQGDVLRTIDLLAAALTAVKEGSEPRLQLEVALLKSTQPRADQSLQALMHRIDRLEAALAGSGPSNSSPPAVAPEPTPVHDSAPTSPPAPEPASAVAPAASPVPAPQVPEAPTSANPAPARMAVTASATAAAVEEEPVVEPVPAPADPAAELDIERITTLWPAVADAIREQNGMVAALLAEAIPTQVEGSRLTIQFPAEAAFSKKKAEANRDLIADAARSLSGRPVTVVFELGEAREQSGPVILTADQLAERLMRDFDAEEIFEDADPKPED